MRKKTPAPPAWANILKVARWEFLNHIKSPVFLVLTFLIPLIMGAVVGVSFLIERLAQQEEIHLAVADRTGVFFPYLEERSAGTPLRLQAVDSGPDEFAAILRDGQYDGILLVEEAGLQEGLVELVVEDTGGFHLMIVSGMAGSPLQGVLTSAVSSYRLDNMGIDCRKIETATAPVALRTRTVAGEEPEAAAMLAPLAAAMALIISVFFSGQILLYGVIKEKRNRVVEILLSSISSLELLLGKMAGFGALSLCQIVIWLGPGLLVALLWVDWSALGLRAGQVVLPLIFFVLGFLMLSSIFAAVGATMKEVEGGSQAQGLIVIIPLVPLFLVTPLMVNPNAPWARILSHLPPFTPTAVLLRMGITTLPTWEIASTLAVLVLSTGLFVWLGAKIFEGSILQYSRVPAWKDLRALFARNSG